MSHTQSSKIIMYGHPACMMVYPIQGMLDKAGVDYEYINIFEDQLARQAVREINSGYESVPTLVFPDGSTLTEPSTGVLSKKLQDLGYDVPLSAALIGNMWLFVMLAGILLVILRAVGVI